MKDLPPKQRKFVQEYLKSLNATKACMKAGYSKANADKIGSILLGKVRIKKAIQQAMDRRAKRAEITQEEIVLELKRIAFANVTDYCSFNASGVDMRESSTIPKRKTRAISEVSQVMNQYGGTTKFKLHDKTKALELLGKHLGMFKERHEVTGKDGEPLSFTQLVQKYSEAPDDEMGDD